MTYTVFDANDASNVFGRGLTAVQTMNVILTYEGDRYEILKSYVQGAVCWDLYHSAGSAHSSRSMVKTGVFSLIENKAKAKREIAKIVCAANWRGLNWRGLHWPELKWSERHFVLKDKGFNAMLAEIAADEAA